MKAVHSSDNHEEVPYNRLLYHCLLLLPYYCVCVSKEYQRTTKKKIKEGKTFFLYLYFSSRAAAAAILQEAGDDGGWHREGVYNTGTLEATHPAAPTLCEIRARQTPSPCAYSLFSLKEKKEI